MHILVIEDQKKVAQSLEEGLRRDGFTVTLAGDGEEGFFLINSTGFDLVILDLGLPKRDGTEILKAIRRNTVDIPVLILTARDGVEDKVEALETGADDYMVKPFAFPELLARVHALLRRRQTHATLLSCKDLVLDLTSNRVSRGSQHIALTPREFELLRYLLRNQDAIVTREMLARDVWHATSRATPLDNVIDVHITHLRRKIDAPFTPKLLHTIRGVGFIVSANEP